MIGLLEASTIAAAALFAFFYAAMWLAAGQLVRAKSIASVVTPLSGRYGSIDGLRGLLAFGVMFHHSVTAYVYFTTGVWAWSKNPVLNHLGQTTVALFFMITGFLFTSQCASRKFNCKKIYLSRMMRLAPLYFLVITTLFLIVISLSKFVITVPFWELCKQYAM